MKNTNKREHRYNVYTDGAGKIIVATTYCGKIVRGVAKCNPLDNYDYDFGVRLATARCDAKIALKREAKARERLALAQEACMKVLEEYHKAVEYDEYATEVCEEALAELQDIYLELK